MRIQAMEKIKVCHIITKLELGGAQKVALYIVSHLDREKFIPVFIAGKGGFLDHETAELNGVKVYLTSSLIRQIRPCRDLLGFFGILRILLKERPGIVHTHSSKAGILGRWAAFIAGVPVIVHTVHGFGFNDSQKGLMRSVLIWVEKLTAMITDRLIVVTKLDKEKGLRHGIGNDEKYALIRAGIDVEAYKKVRVDKEHKKAELGIAPGAGVVTTIGPFKPQKNLKDFVEVAKKVHERSPETIFLIVGDGEQRKDLEFLVYAYGLKDQVKLLGWRNDIAEILAVTDIFAMTSLWEGLPRTILEAMCLKLPVVANAVDGVKEIVKDGISGYLTEPFDTSRMAELIEKLLNDRKLSEEMGQRNSEAMAEEFDVKYMVKQVEYLYIKRAAEKFKSQT